MPSLIDSYRTLRQDFRNLVPQSVRSVARFTQPLWYAEQGAGAFINGPGQTGGDYLPSMFAAESTPSSEGNPTPGSTDNTTTTPQDPGTNNTGGSGNLSDYLNLINQQRGILTNSYNTGYTDVNAQSGRQATALQAKSSQGISDINQNLADTEKVGAENTQLVRTGADAARYSTKQGITSNFSARGAIDSSYFQRAMDAGLGDIDNQEKVQLTAITQALDKARGEATKQKNQIEMSLNLALQDLEAKRQSSLKALDDQYNNGMITLAQYENEAGAPITKWATPEELSKVKTLADTNFAVDQYITSIDSQAQSAIDSIKQSAGETKQAGVDLNNVGQLLNSLGKGLKSGYRKSDFVPLLVSKGYTPEQAQAILDRAELYANQGQNLQVAPMAA